MTTSAALLASLDLISHETTMMVIALDVAAGLPESERREARRRVLEIRARTQELLEWVSEARIEEPRN